ncbi:MAG: hypothetical protein AAF203_08515, partial [Pseudomonadota bacterium]
FHSITQMVGFQKGQFLFNDDNVLDFSFEEFLKYRLNIGFGFSTRGLIHNQSLRQNLELPLRYHQMMPMDEIAPWVEHCAGYFELGSDLDRRPAEVSTNSQKATLVLRAFVHRPELIFLDAPELMLSSKLHANLLQLVDEQRQQGHLKHLFFSTADENLSDCLAEKNIILRRKRLNLVVPRRLQKVAV